MTFFYEILDTLIGVFKLVLLDTVLEHKVICVKALSPDGNTSKIAIILKRSYFIFINCNIILCFDNKNKLLQIKLDSIWNNVF